MIKCPKCNSVLSSVSSEHIDVDTDSTTWKGVAHTCPFCFTAIGVEIDPVALKADIVNELLRRLRG